MKPDKEQLKKEIEKYTKLKKLFLFIAIAIFAAALALLIVAIVLGTNDVRDDSFYLTSYLAGICLCFGITTLILRSVLFSFKIAVTQALLDGDIEVDESGQYKQVIKEVDVKPVNEPSKEESQLTKEQELIKQYEELYKNGYISAEDLETKKKEILSSK